jgi:hypothetical protein
MYPASSRWRGVGMLSQRPPMNCSMKPRIHRSRCQNSEPISLLKIVVGASSRVVSRGL